MVVVQSVSSELGSRGLDTMTVSFPEEAYSSSSVDADLYDTDEFRMYCFKVLPCSKRYSHDWTTCPFAHPAEKARRRDPRVSQYTAIACPEMKKDMICPRGKNCPYSHNDFEYWLHPSRYRTQLCNDGLNCRRKVCFFAHQPMELRVPAYQPVLPDITQNTRSSQECIRMSQEYSLPSIVTADRSSLDLQAEIDTLLPPSSFASNTSNWPLSVPSLSNGPSNLAAALSEIASSEQIAANLIDHSAAASLDRVSRSSLEQMARRSSLEQMAHRSSLEQMARRSSLEQMAQRLANMSLGVQQLDQSNAVLTSQAIASPALLLQQQQLSSQSSQQPPYWSSQTHLNRRLSTSSTSVMPPTIPEDGPLNKAEYGGNPEVAYQSSLYTPTTTAIQSSQVASTANSAEALLRQVGSQQRRHSLDSSTQVMPARILPPHSRPPVGYRHSFDVNGMQHPFVQSGVPTSAALLINQQLSLGLPQNSGDSTEDLMSNTGYMGFSNSQLQNSQDEHLQYLLQSSGGSGAPARWSAQQMPGTQTMANVDLYRLITSMQQQQH